MHLQEYQIQNWPSSMWLTGSQPLLANLIQQTLLPQLHPADYWAPEAFDQVVAIKELRQGLGYSYGR